MPRPELIFLHSVNGGGCNIRGRAVSEGDLGGWLESPNNVADASKANS